MAHAYPAFRPTSKQVQAFKYARTRLFNALKRRGVTLAKAHEIEACNELTRLIDFVTGQQTLKF